MGDWWYQPLVKAGRTRGVLRCVSRVRGLCNKERERERNERKVAAMGNEEMARAEARNRGLYRDRLRLGGRKYRWMVRRLSGRVSHSMQLGLGLRFVDEEEEEKPLPEHK